MVLSSTILIISYLLASGTLAVLARESSAFENVTGLRRGTILLAFGPIAVAWIYGWLLRLFPGQPSLFYLTFVTALILPGGLVQGYRLVQGNHFACLIQPVAFFRQKTWRTVDVVRLLAIVFVVGVFLVIARAALEIPLVANDPLEYFYVARHVFALQNLLDVYPLIDPNIAGGFYGPWTHPPGFVLMIAWGFVVQGNAEIAGAAKLVDVYSFLTLILLVYTWAGGLIRYRGVVAALLVLITPILLGETLDTHVDVPRIAMWTAVFCMLAYWFKQSSLANTVALGVLVGLSMFVHSIGLMFWPIFAGLLLLVRGMSYPSRLIQAVLLTFVATLMVAPDYWQNYYHFGRLIGDSAPLWEIPRFKLNEFLNEQRAIASLHGKLERGILDQLTVFGIYGYAALAAAVSGVFYGLTILVAGRFRPFKILRHITISDLIHVLLLSCTGFVGIIVLSIILDMNLVIKNARYLATMIAVYAIVAALAGDTILRYSGVCSVRRWRSRLSIFWHAATVWPRAAKRWLRRRWRSLLSIFWHAATVWLRAAKRWLRETWARESIPRAIPGSIFLVTSVILAGSAMEHIKYQKQIRFDLFPGIEYSSERSNSQKALVCSRSGSLQLIGKINQKLLAGEIEAPIKVLAFRPSDVAYYAKFPFLSYLDPKLIPAYSATSTKEAHDRLVEIGVSHLLVPYYKMGEIENTELSKLISDPNQVQLTRSQAGFKLFRLRGQPHIFKTDDNAPLQSNEGTPVNIDLSKHGLFVGGSGDSTPLECTNRIHHRLEDNTSIISVEGSQILQQVRKIEIDPKNTYRLSFDLRAFGEGASAVATIGLATFGADGKLQTDPPGTHRYGVAVAKHVPTNGKWNHMSGVFTGVGNEDFNQFRHGTKYVAPIFILNDQSSVTRTDIRNLQFEDVTVAPIDRSEMDRGGLTRK